MPFIQAKKIRTPQGCNLIPNDKPGWYRWWAPKPALDELLGQYKGYGDLLPHLTCKDEQYLIYVGIAVRESILARLRWHIIPTVPQTLPNVRSGRLSTLRQSISSLVGRDQLDTQATDNLIDQLTVEYFPCPHPIGSQEAKDFIEECELKELENNAVPLNIQNNGHTHIQAFKTYLKLSRKEAKQHALNQ